jgi:hypothetical protein
MTFYGDLNYYYRQAKEELIKKADEAMYYSKRNGFNKITLFNKLPRLKLRRLAVVIGVILAGAIFYKLSFKTLISPTLREVKKIKIATKPGDLDAVVLKNGDLYEGRIIEKTGEAEAETADGREAEIKKGDLAFFPQGLSCERYIKSKVKKYYSFE